MLFQSKNEQCVGGLQEQLRSAQALTPGLMADVIGKVCTRTQVLSFTQEATRLDRLITVGAWSDAVLTLIELELPQWKVRRLVFEEGEWLCSLSKQPYLPIGVDDSIEATHETMHLAILGAFLGARRSIMESREVCSKTVPSLRPSSGHAVCCENFA